MTEAEKDKRIAKLEQMLVDQWGVFSDCYIVGNDPAVRERAFLAFDRRLRKGGILPKLEEMKR